MKLPAFQILTKIMPAGLGLAAAQAAAAETTQLRVAIPVSEETSLADPNRGGNKVTVAAEDYSTEEKFRVSAGGQPWSPEDEREFERLLRLRIKGLMTPSQEAVYERIRQKRLQKLSNRTFEQIQADVRLHQATEAAIAALRNLIDCGIRS